MQYGPIYIMVEATVLIMLEKLTMLFPRLSQKLERFYKSVVEEALLGKDPDVAEDFTGTAISTEKVLHRQFMHFKMHKYGIKKFGLCLNKRLKTKISITW